MNRTAFLVVAALVAIAGACSLNPQPFPPDNADAALGLPDASKGNDGSTFGDAAGGIPDAAADSEPVPETDGGSDAADASDDVSVDAPIDALGDAPGDALGDALGD